MERRRVRLENIYVGNRTRAVNEKRVKEIADSIRDVGLMNPPAVRFQDDIIVDGEPTLNVPVLIHGLHRITALKLLGEEMVECAVYDIDGDEALIMEADENLARAEVTGAERTKIVRIREEAWKRKKGRDGAVGVQNLDTNDLRRDGRRKGEQHQKQFATETAERTGQSRSKIYQDLKRAHELGEENIDKIIGTSLHSGVEMDALIDLPPEKRQPIIERAAAGEKVSARPAVVKKTPALVSPPPEPTVDAATAFAQLQATIPTPPNNNDELEAARLVAAANAALRALRTPQQWADVASMNAEEWRAAYRSL